MITILKNLWSSRESREKELVKKLEQLQQKFDLEFEKELSDRNEKSLSSVVHVSSTISDANERESSNNSNCFQRTGIITALKSNHGTIDHGIFFEMNVALSVASELKVGSRVEYLAYKHSETDHIKVVKIVQVVDNYWDEETPTDEKIEEKIKDLRSEQPKFFNTHQRNILGLIAKRKPHSIIVDTDYKTINIHLDSVEIDFIPMEGDRVYICCNVQSDEDFVDRNGEILEEVSVHPARLMKSEKCTVKRLNADWGVLNQDVYFMFNVSPSAKNLNVGDTVSADLIECERGKYVWRCIKLTVLEKCSDKESNGLLPLEARTENHAVVVDPDNNCIFSSLLQQKEIEFVCSNNSNRVFSGHIDFSPRKGKNQVYLIDPKPGARFELKPQEKRSVRFKVESKYVGQNNEFFVIQFENFRIKRSISIIVCETEAEAEAIKQNLALEKTEEYDTNISIPGNRNKTNVLRHYANQVWSNRGEVVPGVSIAPKRRFVANRIGYFEVPERLRSMYLTWENKQDMFDTIEEMFPTIKNELSFSNYVNRFQTLIYLEEIECFLNFRKYDRERAHFNREGEYLSLTIENLSERRPSLVLGDIVRATNPWSDDEDADTRSYDGVIHKVLFNKILMKFNPAFQQRYNGEDYRLEFYFSRFGFRKQHFAVERVVRHLGEKFLFPSNVRLRQEPQLDIQLNEHYDIIYHNTTCKWYNESLNPVQKVAVFKILRGEVDNMPYVIFGPPGTGKTITLVETILQLVKRLPSSRLLVGTPSNSSADLITTRLIKSGQLSPGDFIRLVSQNQIEKDLIPEHLMPYCATIDIAAEGTSNDAMIVTESGLKLKCQMKFLGRHRVTISTCSTLGNFFQMDFPKGHFTHVIIDESGQCTEPEIIIPITQVSRNRCQVILAGDPNQLPAIVTNRYAGGKGLTTSFLERILSRSPYLKDMIRHPDASGFDPRLVTKLLYSYRALPSILHMYNKLFYDSELIPVLNDDSRESKQLNELSDLLPESEKRSKTHGLFFYGMLSENKQENDSPSWYNPYEAKNVFLMTLQLYRKNIKPESIGIITPYAKQVKHLRALFIIADIAMPKIGSVEEFQGQERDIILISTVRSTQNYIPHDIRHSLGFVYCAKRINVAISRARYLLYIFGNPYLLALDPCWHTLIKYCVNNDAYSGCDLSPEMYKSEEITNSTEGDTCEEL